MQIVATFDNYEEMEAFAEKIVREKEVKSVQKKEVPQDAKTPAQPAAPIQQTFTQAPQPAVPTAEQTYTLDELARAGMTLMDAGRQLDLQGLLRKFGVEALPALPKEQYGAFATALREMGAQI